MRSLSFTISIMGAIVVGYQCAVIGPATNQRFPTRVFNYEGNLPPIKDDRTGEVIRGDTIESNSTGVTSEAEKLCFELIVEHSETTFALQNRVLDELNKDLTDIDMNPKLREAIEGLTKKMRIDMEDALTALKDESPEDYFDALFSTSEGIVQLSHLVRDPNLDEKVFLVLIKAVSRLGRNNSMLIQQFIDQCSIASKSPRPRSLLPF